MPHDSIRGAALLVQRQRASLHKVKHWRALRQTRVSEHLKQSHTGCNLIEQLQAAVSATASVAHAPHLNGLEAQEVVENLAHGAR
jgi:hypothetical protein